MLQRTQYPRDLTDLREEKGEKNPVKVIHTHYINKEHTTVLNYCTDTLKALIVNYKWISLVGKTGMMFTKVCLTNNNKEKTHKHNYKQWNNLKNIHHLSSLTKRKWRWGRLPAIFTYRKNQDFSMQQHPSINWPTMRNTLHTPSSQKSNKPDT